MELNNDSVGKYDTENDALLPQYNTTSTITEQTIRIKKLKFFFVVYYYYINQLYCLIYLDAKLWKKTL